MNEHNFLGTERHLRHVFKDSKIIAYASYDTLLLLLLVMFHNGSNYQYSGVDQTTWEEFITATSAGSYLNTVIRKFKCERIK